MPRGAGASAAALLLLASTGYGVVKGGHGPAIAAQIQDICDSAANSVGFRISEIALAGEHEVSREDILSLAGVTGRSSLLFLDAGQTRARLLTNPWIAQATVLKLYPGRLRIEIKERKAFALWQKDGRVYADRRRRHRAGNLRAARASPRCRWWSATAPSTRRRTFSICSSAIRRSRKWVEASVLVAERRWNLHLKNGVDVLLPEGEPAQALATLGRARPRQEIAVARHRHGRSAARRPRHRAAVGRRRGGARRGAQGGRERQEEESKGGEA